MEEKRRRSHKFNVVDIVILLIVVIGVALVGVKFLGGEEPVMAAPTRIE